MEIVYEGVSYKNPIELREELPQRIFIVSFNTIIDTLPPKGELIIKNEEGIELKRMQVMSVKQIKDYLQNRTTFLFYY